MRNEPFSMPESTVAFPGCVDAHMHIGIYAPLAQDAVSESKAAAMGGVTSSLNYMRTGAYYLNRGGPYREFMPEVLQLSDGRVLRRLRLSSGADRKPPHRRDGISRHRARRHVVQDFHVLRRLRAAWRSVAAERIPDDRPGRALRYRAFRVHHALGAAPDGEIHPTKLADHISVSLHCELADILNAYTKLVEREGKLTGLKAYSAARPPHSEGLAVWIASYLANETNCLNINLLHLSSRKAVDAAWTMQQVFPHIAFRREVTVGHLLLDTDCECAVHAKVNPPIRPREDVEALWQAVLDRKIDWIVSDHACCSAEQKWSKDDPDNIWLAKSGFGGTEYLLSGVISEGSKRGMSYNHMAELLSWKPAQRFGLLNKGDIAPGYDADIVLVDPHESFVGARRRVRIRAGLHALRGRRSSAAGSRARSCAVL